MRPAKPTPKGSMLSCHQRASGVQARETALALTMPMPRASAGLRFPRLS